MSSGPDRSRLSLPLKGITARDDSGVPEVASSKRTQQKLMKSLSNPADYFLPPSDKPLHPSCSNSLRESRNYRPLSRAQSIRETISNGAAKFFGVPPSENSQLSVGVPLDQKWSCRRLRFICKHYGNLKDDILTRELRPSRIAPILDDLSDVPSPSNSVTPQSEIRETLFMPSVPSIAGAAGKFCRSKSVESRGSHLTQQHLERRDSVMKIVCDRISLVVQRGTLKPKKGCIAVRRGRSVSSSFAPFSVQTGNITSTRIGPQAGDTCVVNGIRIVPQVDFESSRMVDTVGEPKKMDEKEIEISLTKKGSALPSSVESMQDEVFFDYTLPTVLSDISDTEREEQTNSLRTQSCQGLLGEKFPFVAGHEKEDDVGSVGERAQKTDGIPMQEMQPQCSREESLQNIHAVDEKKTNGTVETFRNMRKKLLLDAIYSELKSKKYSVSHRRRFGGGFGIWRRYFQRSYRKDVYQLNEDTYIDCRPFFTYWITTVQILVTIISLYTYGVGPWGFDLTERTADVLHTTVTLKRVSIYVQQNIWLGPKFADLVHLGAKFAPCMREDPRIFERIEADHKEENETGCCIYNDGTGCFQTGQTTCPSLIATLARWRKDSPGPENRISGAVCGQDPRYCEDPVSVKPYEWPDDMTQWPMCKQTTLFVPENVMHMHCEITGRPCCIQLHGQCRITTRDYCDFVEGYFHENATLCSQVSCLSEVCGMLPFLRRNHPDQWIIHCTLTVFIQILYMRDLEKLLGWTRIAFLYMVSGIGGYLAGAIFVPYKPEVGPAGSHVGMFATMYIDVFYSWNLLERPWQAVMQLSLFTLALFALGTLPWVDNWAHLFGFIFGILISLAILPYIQTKRHNRVRRLIVVVTSLSIALGLFVVLLAVFYWPSDFSCVYCEYFNCIPYTDHFCDNQGLRLKKWPPI
ncbi:unnamed protein product [Litomosoides sigmodontis]|uniref:Peptidase S54 rhomboid domain-containing protein n=1 Tax=Litomosoides sigmodontis TaxID=42156 RepID=A0A3P6TCD2_LITSI|nr:unnamed protein product [Litomosoides sigmodontis]